MVGWLGLPIINTVHEDTHAPLSYARHCREKHCMHITLTMTFPSPLPENPKRSKLLASWIRAQILHVLEVQFMASGRRKTLDLYFRRYKEGRGRILTRKMDNSKFRAGRRSAGAVCGMPACSA
uniref:Uncharacterized protein n=1 Tax=Oryza meridionalis TaxID=40149 RepID=A0A0E0C5E4_9ORYZ